ncbi:MAG TPA: hypothetical protein VFA15_03720, partial [Nitrososphaera sp.]|nr:hypothetical protein [Nitrososphaera sp.]
VVERRSELLHFTPAFCAYAAGFQTKYQSHSVEHWRKVLDSFDPTLRNLSDEEIVNVIVYMSYYLAKGTGKEGGDDLKLV